MSGVVPVKQESISGGSLDSATILQKKQANEDGVAGDTPGAIAR